ncbi:hypothetical protein JB92DRAFT_2911499 [Gautieria morchelliformis]|nr:hypothetical protein JB92DRAFT_2911499 [Gautieria morchelliformis]
MAAQLTPLSASVTRILSLSGFPSELKTRDIQAAFGDWENVNGGFKIKWRDDTSLLIVFADAITAKRAYLQTLASPPTVFSSPTSSKSATIKPYDGADAQAVIQAVNARTHGHNGSRGHHSRSSVSSASINGVPPASRKGAANGALSNSSSLNGLVSIPDDQPLSLQRDPSPTLPNIPAHPTLNALINSSLSPVEPGAVTLPPPGSSAIPIVSPSNNIGPRSVNDAVAAAVETQGTPPRIGDPGRRMVGHALGIRHPGLSPNRAPSPTASPVTSGGADQAMREVQRAMGGLTVSAE